MGKLLDVALIAGGLFVGWKAMEAIGQLGKPGDGLLNKVPDAHTLPEVIPDGDARTAQQLIEETEAIIPSRLTEWFPLLNRWGPVRAQLVKAKRTGKIEDARAAYEGAVRMRDMDFFDKRNLPIVGDDL